MSEIGIRRTSLAVRVTWTNAERRGRLSDASRRTCPAQLQQPLRGHDVARRGAGPHQFITQIRRATTCVSRSTQRRRIADRQFGDFVDRSRSVFRDG